MKYAALIILWIIWCSVHSGMVSLTVTGCLRVKLGEYFRFYRLLYNFTAFITLVPLFLYTQTFRGYVIFRWEGYLLFVKILLAGLSAVLLIAGALKYDMFQFIGVRQIKSGNPHSSLSGDGEIVTSGILGVTRHPWYFGSIIFVWIYYEEMFVSTLVVNIILTVYLCIGAVLEERKLLFEFGASYRDYMTRVSMLFPFKWILSRI